MKEFSLNEVLWPFSTILNGIEEILIKLGSGKNETDVSDLSFSLVDEANSQIFPLTLTLVFSFLALIFFALYGATHWTRRARLFNKFPGPRMLPLIGNLDLVMGQPEDWQVNLSSTILKYGRVARIWLGNMPILLIGDGKVAEKIVAGYDNVEKGSMYRAFHRVLGQGLVTAEGKKWKQDRKILNPGFGFQYFEGFVKIFNEQSKIMVEIMDSTFPNGDEHVNLLPNIARCTLDSVFQTVLGVNRNIQKNPEEQFAEKIYGLVHTTRLKFLKPYLQLPLIWHLFGLGREEDRLIDSMMAVTDKIIREKIRERNEGGEVKGIHTKPFISFLLEHTNDLEDISYHINTLCATGAETTSSGLNYLLFLLALNPSCQQRVQEEIDELLGSERERDLTLADMSNLKYMEMCIKEGLRLYPSVPGWIRKISKDVTLDDGQIIPKGIEVAILPWDIHRNPEVFPDPEVYDPFRFKLENKEQIGSSGFQAFSSGSRNCIGHRYGLLQMKTMLSHILRKFSVHTTNRREDLRVIYGIVLEPVPEIKLTLKRREF